MSGPLVFVDSSRIREGKLDELKAGMRQLAEFVEANEPRTISYDVYLDEAGGRVTVVQVHPDSASMQFHMEAAAHLFPIFRDILVLETMDVYGRPSDEVLYAIREKVEMLGTATVRVHEHHAGFTRAGAPAGAP